MIHQSLFTCSSQRKPRNTRLVFWSFSTAKHCFHSSKSDLFLAITPSFPPPLRRWTLEEPFWKILPRTRHKDQPQSSQAGGRPGSRDKLWLQNRRRPREASPGPPRSPGRAWSDSQGCGAFQRNPGKTWRGCLWFRGNVQGERLSREDREVRKCSPVNGIIHKKASNTEMLAL